MAGWDGHWWSPPLEQRWVVPSCRPRPGSTLHGGTDTHVGYGLLLSPHPASEPLHLPSCLKVEGVPGRTADVRWSCARIPIVTVTGDLFAWPLLRGEGRPQPLIRMHMFFQIESWDEGQTCTGNHETVRQPRPGALSLPTPGLLGPVAPQVALPDGHPQPVDGARIEAGLCPGAGPAVWLGFQKSCPTRVGLSLPPPLFPLHSFPLPPTSPSPLHFLPLPQPGLSPPAPSSRG